LNALRTRVIELEKELEGCREKVESMRVGEQRYRLFSENVRDVIWTMDLNLQYTYISPSIKDLRGYTPEEALDQTVAEVMTPTSADHVRQAFIEEAAQEQTDPPDWNRSVALELELYCKDGTTVWVEVMVSFLRDREGVPNGLLGVSRDISERRQAEVEMKKWAHVSRMPLAVVVTPCQMFLR